MRRRAEPPVSSSSSDAESDDEDPGDPRPRTAGRARVHRLGVRARLLDSASPISASPAAANAETPPRAAAGAFPLDEAPRIPPSRAGRGRGGPPPPPRTRAGFPGEEPPGPKRGGARLNEVGERDAVAERVDARRRRPRVLRVVRVSRVSGRPRRSQARPRGVDEREPRVRGVHAAGPHGGDGEETERERARRAFGRLRVSSPPLPGRDRARKTPSARARRGTSAPRPRRRAAAACRLTKAVRGGPDARLSREGGPRGRPPSRARERPTARTRASHASSVATKDRPRAAARRPPSLVARRRPAAAARRGASRANAATRRARSRVRAAASASRSRVLSPAGWGVPRRTLASRARRPPTRRPRPDARRRGERGATTDVSVKEASAGGSDHADAPARRAAWRSRDARATSSRERRDGVGEGGSRTGGRRSGSLARRPICVDPRGRRRGVALRRARRRTCTTAADLVSIQAGTSLAIALGAPRSARAVPLARRASSATRRVDLNCPSPSTRASSPPTATDAGDRPPLPRRVRKPRRDTALRDRTRAGALAGRVDLARRQCERRRCRLADGRGRLAATSGSMSSISIRSIADSRRT